jgi:hypothetical protein
MQNEFNILSRLIKEEFQKNSFNTLLKELTKISKSKTNKNYLKVLLIRIKIDIENTEINIVNKLGQYFNLIKSQNKNGNLSNLKKCDICSYTSLNNSLINKFFQKSKNKSFDNKNYINSNKALFSKKFMSYNNSKENILKDINKSYIEYNINKNNNKRSNSQSASNLIRVKKKISNKNLEMNHQNDFIIINSSIKNENKNMDNELPKDIIEFFDNMKLLQENIIYKTPEVKSLKYTFEKKKNALYQKAYDMINSNNKKKIISINDKKKIEINTNYFNKTLDLVKNNFQNKINELNQEIEFLKNKINEENNLEIEYDKIKSNYLDSIIKIYNLLLSSNKNIKKNSSVNDNSNPKNKKAVGWYIKQIEEIINNMNLNYSSSQNIINISGVNKENIENENKLEDINYEKNLIIMENNIIIEYKNNKSNRPNELNKNKEKDEVFKKIMEMMTLVLPAINGIVEKDNENLVYSKMKEDYEQQGIEFILILLNSYVKELVNMLKDYQRQSNFKFQEFSNSNANKETNLYTNSFKENDIYIQNIQKKFIIVDRNNEGGLFDDEKINSNLNINSSYNSSNNIKGIKTPNQTIKNICKEIQNRSGADYQSKIFSIISTIQNNLFAKIQTKENEIIELNNKIKDLLRINKEIKNNVLSDENNIFLKKYNFLNSLYNEDLEKIKILEVEYLSLIKELCNYIQYGDKIIIRLDKLFNKYNNKINNNDSIYNGEYDLEQSNESDLLSSIEKAKNDDIFHFLNQNDKSKINENKKENDLIIKYKKEIENLNKIINEMKIRLMIIGNNLNKLIKDKYIYDNYNDMICALFKLLNYSDKQIKQLF